MYDVARLFCINVLGKSFEQVANGGAFIPMQLTTIFNITIEVLVSGLKDAEGQLRASFAQHRNG